MPRDEPVIKAVRPVRSKREGLRRDSMAANLYDV
jgi:hypothetical protein